jgi:hypothetical protein
MISQCAECALMLPHSLERERHIAADVLNTDHDHCSHEDPGFRRGKLAVLAYVASFVMNDCPFIRWEKIHELHRGTIDRRTLFIHLDKLG